MPTSLEREVARLRAELNELKAQLNNLPVRMATGGGGRQSPFWAKLRERGMSDGHSWRWGWIEVRYNGGWSEIGEPVAATDADYAALADRSSFTTADLNVPQTDDIVLLARPKHPKNPVHLFGFSFGRVVSQPLNAISPIGTWLRGDAAVEDGPRVRVQEQFTGALRTLYFDRSGHLYLIGV